MTKSGDFLKEDSMNKDYLDRYSILEYLEKYIEQRASTFLDNYILFLINVSKLISKLSKNGDKQLEEISAMVGAIKNIEKPSGMSDQLSKLLNTHKKNLDKILDEENEPLRKYRKILKENLRYVNLKTNQQYLKGIYKEFTEINPEILIIDNKKMINKSTNKICFCSHSNEDKLYTLGLFLYFYLKYNIFIYLYWMYDDNTYNGFELKRHFYEMINISDHFIFIKTIYSELEINGTSFDYLSIKQWCAWELGCFYNLSTNGFYINSFENESSLDNKLLDGFVLLEDIRNQLS